jgi:hypothetical protein
VNLQHFERTHGNRNRGVGKVERWPPSKREGREHRDLLAALPREQRRLYFAGAVTPFAAFSMIDATACGCET